MPATPEVPAHPFFKLFSLGSGPARDIQWSADGRQLAVLGSSQVTWYDTETLEPVSSAEVSQQPSYGAVWFASDDGTLATWAQDTPAAYVLLDSRTGSDVARLTIGSAIGPTALSADKRILAISQFADNPPHRYLGTQIWDVAEGKRLYDLLDDQTLEDVHLTALSDDGTVFAAGSSDGYLRAWKVEGGELVRELDAGLRVEKFNLLDAQFDPTGSLLAYCDAGGVLWFWNLQANRLSRPQVGSLGSSCHIQFSSDGRYLVVGSSDGPIYLLDLSASFGTRHVTRISDSYRLRAVTVASDTGLFATLDRTGRIDLWHIPSGSLDSSILRYNEDLTAIVWSPDGSHVATAAGSGGVSSVALWKVDDRSLVWRSNLLGSGLSGLLMSPDGQVIYALPAAQSRMAISLIHAQTGDVILTLGDGQHQFYAAALSASGDQLAVADEADITLWETSSRNVGSVTPFDETVLAMWFSSDGAVLQVIHELRGEFRLSELDWRTGELLRSMPLAGYLWNPVASPSGDRVVVMGEAVDHYFSKMVDLRSGSEIFSIQEQQPLQDYRAADFTPDGQLLGLADWAQAYLLDAVTGRLLATIPDTGASLAFSPDGTKVAIGGSVVTVWEMSLGLQESVSHAAQTPTPDVTLTAAAATIAAYTPTADLRGYIDQWRTYEDSDLGIRFEYPRIYDDMYEGACAPKLYPADPDRDTTPSLLLGDRTWIDLAELTGSFDDYVQRQLSLLDDGEDSYVVSSDPIRIGRGQSLVAHTIQYRFGALGRLAIAYFVPRDSVVVVISFTAGVTCDFREIEFSELDALDRLLTTLEFVD